MMSQIGDVYEINLNAKTLYYMQLVGFDLPNMNSDVVIVTRENPLEVEPTKENILFYTHSVVDAGNRKLWNKIGNTSPTIELSSLLFKTYRDETVGEVEKLVDPSSITVPFPNWYVWTPTDEEFRLVPNEEGQALSAEDGDIYMPEMIIERIKKTEKSQ